MDGFGLLRSGIPLVDSFHLVSNRFNIGHPAPDIQHISLLKKHRQAIFPSYSDIDFAIAI